MHDSTQRPWMRPLGATGVHTSAVIAGGSPLGGMPEVYGYDVGADEASAVVSALFHSSVRSIDTSNGYSGGESERRIGAAIREAGGLPEDFTVFTKVDPDWARKDFSAARVRASLAESEERLGVRGLPLVYLHDPEFFPFDAIAGPGGAVEELIRLKEEGRIGGVGLAGGDTRVLERYLDLGVFDALLTHNRWSLVDRSAGPLIDQAVSLGMGVVNAAVYGGGLLADPSASLQKYGYGPASPEVLESIRKIQEVLREIDVPIAHAALQFSLRDPRVDSTVVGISKAHRITSIESARASVIPEDVWDRLDELTPPAEFWLDSQPMLPAASNG